MIRKLWGLLVQKSLWWKTAFAAGIAWYVAGLTGATRPYFAPLAAILCLQITVEESLSKGYQRVIGIICGVILADIVGKYIGIHSWSIALLVLLGVAGASLLRLGAGAVPQVGVSAMMVLTVGAGHYSYGFDRIVDTLIGAAIAILVNMLIVPPDYSESAEKAIRKAVEELVARFEAMIQWLNADDESAIREGERFIDYTRQYIKQLHVTEEQVNQAVRALHYSPLVLNRRRRLKFLADSVLRLRQGYAHAAGMMRTMMAWRREAQFGEAERRQWATLVTECIPMVQAWVQNVVVPGVARRHSVPERSECMSMPTFAQVDKQLQYHFALLNDMEQLRNDFTTREERQSPEGRALSEARQKSEAEVE